MRFDWKTKFCCGCITAFVTRWSSLGAKDKEKQFPFPWIFGSRKIDGNICARKFPSIACLEIPFWGNFRTKLKFLASWFFLSWICSCLSENANFSAASTILTHNVTVFPLRQSHDSRLRPGCSFIAYLNATGLESCRQKIEGSLAAKAQIPLRRLSIKLPRATLPMWYGVMLYNICCKLAL